MIILSNIRLLNFEWLTMASRVLDLYDIPSIAGNTEHDGFFLTMLRNFEKRKTYHFIVVPDTAEIRDLLDRENIYYIRLTVVDGYDMGSNLMTCCNVYAREHNRKIVFTSDLNDPALRNRIVTLAALSTLCNSMSKPKEFIDAVSGLFGYTIAQDLILKNTTERPATTADVMVNDLLRYYESDVSVIPKVVLDEVTKKYGRTITCKFFSYEDLTTAAAATRCYTINLREAFDMERLNEEYGPMKGPEEE